MNSKIIWFTGLSGSGKTTLSNKLFKLLKKKNKKVIQIDGDKFRKKLNTDNSFTKKDIVNNNIQIINYCESIIKKYDFILVSVISPFLKTRKLARSLFKDNYYEIFVHCKLNTLIKRDTKDLYRKAKKKIIINLIGYKSKIKYQKSNYSKIKINTDLNTIAKSVKIVLKKIL